MQACDPRQPQYSAGGQCTLDSPAAARGVSAKRLQDFGWQDTPDGVDRDQGHRLLWQWWSKIGNPERVVAWLEDAGSWPRLQRLTETRPHDGPELSASRSGQSPRRIPA
jgi:hypothetical protein